MLTVSYDNDTTADIRSGAIVDAGSLLVMARSDSRNISIATQGGKSDGLSVSGAASALLIDDNTVARIDDGAFVTTRNGLVSIPRDFDEFDTGQNSLFTTIATFTPQETTDIDTTTQRVDVDTDTIDLPYAHGLETGDAVRYFNGGGENIGGLTSNQFYYVIKVDDTALQLAATPTGSAIDLDLDATSGTTHALLPGFTPADVETGDPTIIDLGHPHNLVDGYQVVYQSGDGNAIGPLGDAAVYFVQRVDDTRLRLSLTENGDAIVLDPSVATGTAHFLIPITATTVDEVAPGAEPRTLRVINPLESLDTNGDRKVTAEDEHVRAITADAYLTDLSLLVLADDNADLYSGTGGIAKGHSVGAGVSISVDRITRSTRALIGNLEFDFTQDGQSSVGVGVDSQDEIYLGYNHGFFNGDRVTYAGGGDLEIGGLRDGESYFVALGSDSDSSGDPVFTLGRTAAEATATFSDTAIDGVRNVIDLGYVHGFQLGDAVRYQAGSSESIGGLVDGETYFVIPISPTAVALTENAAHPTNSFHSVFDPADTVQGDTLVFAYEHGYIEGQPLRYGDGGGSTIPGLLDGETYYVHVVDANVIELRTTSGSETSITLGAPTDVGHFHTFESGLLYSASTVTGTSMTGSSNTINLGYWHGLETGQPVHYTAVSTPITGLTNGTVYYAIVDGEQTIALATTPENAVDGRWQFFDAENSIESNVIELEYDHGYEVGDPIVYSREGFYSSGASDATSPIAYTDSNNNTGTLTEGATYYAIPIYSSTQQVYDSDTDTLSPLSLGIKLALTPADAANGIALTLDNTSSTGFHGFYLQNSRIALDASAADGSPQYLTPDFRLDVSPPSNAGATHTLRLSLEPEGTLQETHGLGRVLTPTASSEGTFNPASAVVGNIVTQTHSFATGDSLVYDDGKTASTEATAIGGLYRGQVVYAIVTGPNTFQVAATEADALAGTAIALDASQAVGASHEFRATSIDANSAIDLGYTHGFTTGDAVVYSNGGGTSIGGIGHGNVYYAIVVSPTKIQLAETAPDAVANLPIRLSPYYASGTNHGFGRAFRALPIVDNHANTVSFPQSHPFRDGQLLTYQSDSGTAIGGLSNGESYYVNVVDSRSVQLSLTPGGPAIPLDGTLATGTEHRLGTLSGTGSVISSGDGALIAHNGGEIVSVTLAASIITKNKSYAPPSAPIPRKDSGDAQAVLRRSSSVSQGPDAYSGIVVRDIDDNLIVEDAPPPVDDQSDEKKKPRRSWSFAGDVAVNIIKDTTLAAISDVDVTFRNLDVTATNRSNSVALSGAVAYSAGSEESKGIAGSIAVNVIDNDTYAVIERSTVIITAGDLKVDAVNDSNIVTVGIGGAGVSGVFGLAGSVAVNTIGSEAQAKIIDNSVVTTIADPIVANSGKVLVTGKDDNDIVSIAGAGAIVYGDATRDRGGVGAAININVIKPSQGTLAIIEDSDVTADDQVVIAASNDNEVTVVTAALASVANGLSAKSLAAAVSVGVAEVHTTTRASARRKKNTGVSGKRGVTIDANDNTHVVTVAGGAALAGSLGGFSGSGRAIGASITSNFLDQQTIADINSMPVISTEGNVSVEATSAPIVTSVAAGAAIGGSAAGQGSFSISTIDNDTRAYITGAPSTILTDGSVKVVAADESQLVSVAGSVALGSLFSNSSDPITSVGIAHSRFVTSNEVSAFIDNDVTVQANGNRGTVSVPTKSLGNDQFVWQAQRGVAVAAVSNDTITNVAAGGAITARRELPLPVRRP